MKQKINLEPIQVTINTENATNLENVIAQKNTHYYFVDEKGNTINEGLKIKIQGDKLFIYTEEMNPNVEQPLLVVENYKEAFFHIPEENFTFVYSNDFNVANIENIFLKPEIVAEEISPTLLSQSSTTSINWWLVGGVAAGLGGLALLLGGKSSGSSSEPAKPKTTIDLNNVTENNVINSQEAKNGFVLMGKVNNAPENSVIKLFVNNNPVDVNVKIKDGNFVIEAKEQLLKSLLNNDNIKIELHSQEGEVLAHSSKSYQVKLNTSVHLTADILSVAGDDFISLTEAKKPVEVKVNVSGLDKDAKANLTLMAGDEVLGSLNNVVKNGTHSILVDGNKLKGQPLTVKVNATDSEQNSHQVSSLEKNYTVESEGAVVSFVKLTSHTGKALGYDNVVNRDDHANADEQRNTTVILKVSQLKDGSNVNVVLKDGSQILGEKLVNQNGEISFDFATNLLSTGTLSIETLTTDKHNNTKFSSSLGKYKFDKELSEPVITIENITVDNVINKTEQNGEITVKVVVSGLKEDETATLVLVEQELNNGGGLMTSQIGRKTDVSNGEHLFTVNGDRLTTKELKVISAIKDSYGNTKTLNEVVKNYDVITDIENISTPLSGFVRNDEKGVTSIISPNATYSINGKILENGFEVLTKFDKNEIASNQNLKSILVEATQEDNVLISKSFTNINDFLDSNHFVENGERGLNFNIGKVTDSEILNNFNSSPVKVKVTLTDIYGNVETFESAETNINFDKEINAPTTSILSVAENNIINLEKSNQSQPLKFKVENLDDDANVILNLYSIDKTSGIETKITSVGNIEKNKNGEFEVSLPNTVWNNVADGNVSFKLKGIVKDEVLNEKEFASNTFDVVLKKSIQTPTATITEIATDGVISHNELDQNVTVKTMVGNLEPNSTSTVSLYNDGTLLTTKNVSANGEVVFEKLGNTLTTKNLKVVVNTTDSAENQAQAENTKSYEIDTTTNPIEVEIVSVAGIALNDDKTNLSKVISSVHTKENEIPVKLNLTGLEKNGSANITVSVNNQTFNATINQNGETTIMVSKEALIATNNISVNATAQDGYANPTVSTNKTVNYTTDLTTSTPTVEVTSIGDKADYELYRKNLNLDVPVKVNVSGMDNDASATIVLKVGNGTQEDAVFKLTNVQNGEQTFNIKGEILARAGELRVEVVATDVNENQASANINKTYNVENFLVIKEIDADFNISLDDNKETGVALTGEVNIEGVLNEKYRYLTINSGDLWRWVDTVTFTFENGKTFNATVSHKDNDNNLLTADENTVSYSLNLTKTEWESVKDQKFKVTANRLKGRDGQDLKTVFALSDNNETVYYEDASRDGTKIQTLNITVNQNADDNVMAIEGNANGFTHMLKAPKEFTIIKGYAGGNDVVAGQEVIIRVNTKEYRTHLLEDKTFEIEVKTIDLLQNGKPVVTASLNIANSTTLTTEETYTHSNFEIFKPTKEQVDPINTIGNISRDDRPYFIRSLFTKDTHNSGFIKDKTAGEAIVIKYSFADPKNADFDNAMNTRNTVLRNRYNDEGYNKYHYRGGVAFTEENKDAIREALKTISSRTKITFKESENYLPENEGLNFILQEMGVNGGGLLGFAQHGFNVHLNATRFGSAITTTNQGFSTVVHETLHALGLKHPFEHTPDKDNGNSGKVGAENGKIGLSSEMALFSCPCGCGRKFSFQDLNLDNRTESENIDRPTDDDVLSNAENRTLLTLMSYTPDIHEFRNDLRMFDLAALHYLYGVNETEKAGNDTYGFKNFNRESVDGDMYIWDGAGNDTFSAKYEKEKVVINLTPGSYSYIGEERDGNFVANVLNPLTRKDYFNNPDFAELKDNNTYDHLKSVFNQLYPSLDFVKGKAFIGYGTVIENAIGSDFNDVIKGNNANNKLDGEKGDDELYGFDGNDLLNGGEGADRMEGGNHSDVYIVDNERDQVIEKPKGGYNDKVFATVSYTVPEEVEEVELLGTKDLDLTSTFKNNVVLKGNSGNNTFTVDKITKMYGNGGEDIFVLNNHEARNSQIMDFGSDDKIEIRRSFLEEVTQNDSGFEVGKFFFNKVKGKENLWDLKYNYSDENSSASGASDGNGDENANIANIASVYFDNSLTSIEPSDISNYISII